MNHSGSYEAPKKIVQEFANKSTTRQAPLRRRQPGRHQWQRCPRTAGKNMVLSTPWGYSSAGLAKDTVTYPRTVPMAKARANSRTTSARASTTGTKAATAGCTWEVERLTLRALMVPSRGTGRVTASQEGTDPVMVYTCSAEHFARDCAKCGGKGGFRAQVNWETWEEPPQVEHARVLPLPREPPPKHAGPRELRNRFLTWADMNCNCKGGHQQVEGESLAPPGLQARGQDGER